MFARTSTRHARRVCTIPGNIFSFTIQIRLKSRCYIINEQFLCAFASLREFSDLFKFA